jgi:hypothetical protein
VDVSIDCIRFKQIVEEELQPYCLDLFQPIAKEIGFNEFNTLKSCEEILEYSLISYWNTDGPKSRVEVFDFSTLKPGQLKKLKSLMSPKTQPFNNLF